MIDRIRPAVGALLCAAALLSGCNSSVGVTGVNPVVSENHAYRYNPKVKTIQYDTGGLVVNYARQVKAVRESGKLVRVSGVCDSACTLYLSLPRDQLCITRGASFGFHAPYGGGTRGNAIAERYLMKKYPSWVRSWINRKGGLNSEIKRISYSQARRHIRECAPSDSV